MQQPVLPLRDRDPADVLVDFSSPSGLADSLTMAKRFEMPLVVGTTGLGEDHQALIDETLAQYP